MPGETIAAAGNEALEALRARRAIVVNRRMEVFPDRRAVITEQLAARGFEVEQIADEPRAWEPADVVWLFGNLPWFPRVVRSLLDTPPERRPATVLWLVEPLPPPRSSGLRRPLPTPRELAKIGLRSPKASDVYTNVRWIRRCVRDGLLDAIIVGSGERRQFLAELGIEAIRVPYGLDASDGSDLGLERDIDVLMLGTVNGHRKRVLARLRKAGIDIRTEGSYFDPSLWGDSRTQLVNRAKIMLSISRFPGTFAAKRFLIAMACGALVVSDPLIDPAPYVPGEHFVEAPSLDELPATIQRALADEPERLRIAGNGRRLVMTELPFERTFATALDYVGARLA